MTDDRFKESWLELPECMRDQIIARDVFGESVDMETGMVMEAKESGGMRMSAITPLAKRENGVGAIIEKLQSKGWTVQIKEVPRSTRHTVYLIHEETGMKVKTHVMPQVDAVRYAAFVASEMEKMWNEETTYTA